MRIWGRQEKMYMDFIWNVEEYGIDIDVIYKN